ncbi:c-type cytochrome [Kineobactrum salinum]|nr:cytochrome c [Kineobactrum salinum]
MTLSGGLPALAEDRPYSRLGATPTPEKIKAWDTAIGPKGEELPSGSGTAKEGAPIFAAQCAMCHRVGSALVAYEDTLYMRMTSALVGGRELLAGPNPIVTVGNFWPYATALWDYINRAMPQFAPGSLNPDEVYALSAWILFKNGIIEEDEVMDAQSLPKVRMPNRDGFVPGSPDWKKYNECNPRDPECSDRLME